MFFKLKNLWFTRTQRNKEGKRKVWNHAVVLFWNLNINIAIFDEILLQFRRQAMYCTKCLFNQDGSILFVWSYNINLIAKFYLIEWALFKYKALAVCFVKFSCFNVRILTSFKLSNQNLIVFRKLATYLLLYNCFECFINWSQSRINK